jgi:thiol-disulfide isomerase/thioredoxin
MKFLLLLLLLATAVMPSSVAAQTTGTASIHFKNTKKMPAYALQNLNGGSFLANSVQKKGHSMVVVYFSPTCSHCIAFTETLTASLKKFSPAVQFFYVSAYPAADMKNFAATQGLLKMPQFTLGHDSNFLLGQFYQLKELPAVFVYNSAGLLVNYFDAKVKMEEIIEATR